MKPVRLLRGCVWVTLWTALALAGSQTIAAEPFDSARVAEWAAMLPKTPQGGGRPITDRAAWDEIAQAREFRDVIRSAERLLNEPIAEVPDDLYLEFSRNGNRTRYQRAAGRRHGRVGRLVLAECLENRGRFLPAIEEAIAAVAEEKTWVLPAHDRALENFRGTTVEIDLVSSAMAWELATAAYWLGDRLSEDTRKLIQSELERRAFQPFEGYMVRGQPKLWWPVGDNNWNSVCLAGVTGAAMAAIESPERRARFAAAAEAYVQNFLKGFTSDGYCSEGMGYWNYGFGHYILLSETLQQATGGRVDLLADPKVRPVAEFARRLEIMPGIFPAFADCHVGARPDGVIMAFLSRRFGWGMKEVEDRGLLLASGASGSLFEIGVYGFPNSASASPTADGAGEKSPRDWFSEAGILICRPRDQEGLAAALKGGHNAEQHNHNDVGSFVVALGGQTPLLDPGAEVYTERTFSGRRYESKLLNSYGHPVPRIGDVLQSSGRSAQAKVVKTEFTDDADTLVLDLASAYKVPGVEKLQRTFVFSRGGAGSLTVTDEVELESAQPFETALVTLSKWSQAGDNRLLVGEGKSRVEVQIDTAGQAFTVRAEEINEDRNGELPTRLAIALQKPVKEAAVRLTIRPAAE